MKFFLLAISLLLSACTSDDENVITIDTASVKAGSSIQKQGKELALFPGRLTIDQPLDMAGLRTESLQSYKLPTNKVCIISIVPSLDTKVCDVQTHTLGETILPDDIVRISISRDLPMAQKRFAENANLKNITYLSDYAEGAFGRRSGLLLIGPRLLTRSVIVIDKKGIIRHMQIVPELTHLPDMKKAFDVARHLRLQN